MKILITGGSGQVGYELQRSLSIFGEIVAPDRVALDLENLQAVNQYLIKCKPDLIVNAAAWTAVDKAEEEQQKAYLLNSKLPNLLAEYASTQEIWIVHYSTDYVYPGHGNNHWTESSQPGPLSVYGKSKLEGDQRIVTSGADYIIFRTSWVYSARRNNFMKTILRLAADKEKLSIVNDQFGAPTPARMIADTTALAVSQITKQKYPSLGVYHLTSGGEVSWYQFACEILKQAMDQKLDLKIASVTGVSTKEYPTPAERPLNSRLDTKKIQSEFCIELPNWQQQLRLTLNEYTSCTSREV